MDNPLSDKEKLNSLRTQDGQSPLPPADGTVLSQPQPHHAPPGFGAYSGASSYNPELSQKALDNGHKQWKDTLKGRLAIRTFSRGIMGAVFFAAGGLLANKWLKEYDPTKSLTEHADFKNGGNPLAVIAKCVDKFIGTPLEMTVSKGAGLFMEKNAAEQIAGRFVRFRPTRYDGYAHTDVYGQPFNPSKSVGKPYGHRGRSLGQEAVGITFDFFCASVGDAWGRDLAGLIDPNARHVWKDDKGNINVPKAILTALDSARRYVMYNGGEDWAVALPYAYYMKAQRSIINHFVPGFIYDFDRGLNGASYKAGKHGKVVGTYAFAGMADFQGRFTAYNAGTVMFRELYTYLDNKLHGRPARLYGSPEDTMPRGVMGTLADLGKWFVRDVVKAVIYMTPAVPFFSITRVTQNRHRGVFINKDKGAISYHDSHQGKSHVLYAHEYEDTMNKLNRLAGAPSSEKERMHKVLAKELYLGDYKQNYNSPVRERFVRTTGKTPINNPSLQPGFELNSMGRNLPEEFMDGVGCANRYAAESLDGVAHMVDNRLGHWGGNWLKDKFGIKESFTEFTRPFINAAISYTPYMMVKAETARLWDTGKMDKAVEDAIEGAARLNWGAFTSGLGEVRDAFLHRPFADPAHEAEGERRKHQDQSPSDVFRETEGQRRARIEKLYRAGYAEGGDRQPPVGPGGMGDFLTGQAPGAGWEQRLMTGRAPQEQEKSHAQRLPQKSTGSFADREALKEALANLESPSTSLH